MKVITEDSKNIAFYEGNHIVLKLVYSGRFSKKASIIDAENLVYEIVAVGFWKNRFEISLNQKCLLNIRKKWAGNFVIYANEDSVIDAFTFKRKGFLNSRYVIQDKDDRELAIVRPKFRWSVFRYDFDIEINDSLKRHENYFLILGMMIYLFRMEKKQHARSGAGAGAAIAAIS